MKCIKDLSINDAWCTKEWLSDGVHIFLLCEVAGFHAWMADIAHTKCIHPYADVPLNLVDGTARYEVI